MAYFVSCHKIDDASYISRLYFKELVRLHGLLIAIMLNKDVNSY